MSKTNNSGIGRFFLSALVLFAVVFIQSCKEDEVEEPAAVCTTTDMSYADDIAPIILANCSGCHSGDNPTSGFVLTSYPAMEYGGKLQVDSLGNSYLLTILNQTDTAFSETFMPPNGKISSCDIDKITSWIMAGAPDN